MILRAELVDNPAAVERLGECWDSLVAANSALPGGHDATSGPLWFDAVSAAFEIERNAKVVVVRDGDTVVAILPVACEPTPSFCRRVFVPTVLYGGRNGFLLSQPSVEMLGALLGGVRKAFGRWQSMRMILVEASDSEQLLKQVCEREGYRSISDSEGQSPYFPLLSDATTFSAKMSKGLKQTLRTSANKFRALGELEFRELFDESDAEAAFASILAIDRGSWKHDAGTAITCHAEQERFYRALFPRALRAGLLYGQILLLNGKPIAFNFGLVHAGIFYCLKHSQTVEFQGHSPGQLLNANMITQLRTKGVTMYDFMGKPEPHKLRWSDATDLYGRRQFWIYSPTLCGWLGWTWHSVKRLARGVLRGRKTAAAQEAPTGE